MKFSRSGHPGKMVCNLSCVGVCALVIALALSPAAVGQSDGKQPNPLHTASRTELDIVKVLLVQEKLWNAGDLEGYVKQYKDSPDTLFVGSQISKGYAQILEDYKHNYPTRATMGTLAFSELEVHSLSENFGICLGRYRLDRPKRDGGSAAGMFSLVLEKTDLGWKIVLGHPS